jgi:formimidoylglutamate deiminase
VEAFPPLAARLPAGGIAAHSPRAVPPDRLAGLVAGADALVGADCPLHVHVAEQPAEVEECLAATGRRPVELLAAHVELGPRWNLVHATHAAAGERATVAASGATVVICPLTEAYLGDGLFPVAEFARAGGRVAVGSDANVRIDAIEELRWLEYGQRLLANRRARLADGRGLGAALWSRVAAGGAAALGQPTGRLEPGAWADLVALDPDAAVLQGAATPDAALDALVTAGDGRCLAGCWVGGSRVAAIEEGADFRQVVRALMAGLAA